MRLLANENFPGDAVEALRLRGHDVVWVRTDSPGSTDEEVIGRVVSEGRVLITIDRDFGELAFRRRLSVRPGVILFRIPPASPAYVAEMTVTAIEAQSDWTGQFAVVEEQRIRVTRLPSGDDET